MGKPLVACAADLSHAPEAREILEKSCRVRYLSPAAEELAEALKDADAYYATLTIRLTDAMMAEAPGLRVVATPSTGLDHIDMEAAARRGIAVLGIKDDRELLDRITATAELAWALILACARHLPGAVQAARNGHWARDLYRGHQIAYKTLGILGLGRLGTIVAGYGQAFRLRVLACDRNPVRMPGVEMVAFDRLLRESDILTVHIHMTEDNRHLFRRDTFRMMKRGAILINTSRGGILDEPALIEALDDGTLSAAGLDVIDGEWREDLESHPLIAYSRTHDHLIITPHIGGVTYESQAMAFAATAEKLVRFMLDGDRKRT
jgi:D-3-phosphoglycerate dehydrogenase